MCNITLKKLREQNNKTVAEIAHLLNVSKESVYKYERGIRKISLEHVLKLSKAYSEAAEDIIKAQINSCQNAR